MKDNKNLVEDLRLLRPFMKEKKISFNDLSKEMEYSTSHVVKVFNGGHPPTAKFRRRVLEAIIAILKKDLYEFYTLMKGETSITFAGGSVGLKEFVGTLENK